MTSSSSVFSKFSEDVFDPKDWINVALRSKDPQQGLDAHASTLVMKLQLIIQEVNNALEETSLQAVQSLPRVLHDVESVRQEAQLLREQMQVVKEDIKKVEEETHQSMKHLLQLDRIKCRMQDAKAALEQAGQWSSHASDMESVFSSQPSHVIATKIAAMRQSLDVLRDVSDYHDRVSLLEQYSNQLEAKLSTPLVEAFTAHSLEAAREYASMFSKIGREAQLRSYYIRYHKSALLQCWSTVQQRVRHDRGSDRQDICQWLAEFYDESISVWHAEAVWCQQVLPSPCAVLCSLFSQSLSNLDPSLVTRVQECVNACDSTQALPQLIAIRDVTLRFAKQLENSLSSSVFDDKDEDGITELANAVHSPFLNYLLNYEDLEKSFLMASLSNARLEVSGFSDTIRWVADSVPKMFEASEMALQHCVALTSGFGAVSLLRAIEHLFKQYCSRLSGIIKTVRTNTGLNGSTAAQNRGLPSVASGDRLSAFGDRHGADEDWTQLHNSVKLIEACGDLIVHADTFEERLRTVLTTRCTFSLSTSSSATSITPTSAHLPDLAERSSVASGSSDRRGSRAAAALSNLSCYNYLPTRPMDGQRDLKRLATCLQSLTPSNSSGALLPTTRSELLQLNDHAHRYAYDVIMAELQDRLDDMARLTVWASVDDSADFDAASVPKFSLAPQDYIQHVTECLLSLPQELEHLGSSDMSPALLTALQAGSLPHTAPEDETSSEGAASHNFADQWLGCFARGLMELFLHSALNIAKLSEHGAQQLLADLKYLCKVIDAFGVSPSDDLQHLQTLLSSGAVSYSALATSTRPQLFSQVAAIRGIRV